MLNYIKAILVNIKSGFSGKIVWINSLKKYIVFCRKCGEYICNDGICSNPFCPEKIVEIEVKK